MKKVIIIIVIVIAIFVGTYVVFDNLNKDKEHSISQGEIQNDDNYFEKLVQYKAESIKDKEKLNALLRNLELGEYIVDIKEELLGEDESLTIYYDCTNDAHVREYFRDFQKQSNLQKNSVTLFALINNLQKVTYNFNISDTELAEKYHLGVLTTTNKFLERSYSFTREQINRYYNQDVRNYVENPYEFMKYNIDLDVSNITIYKLNYEPDGKKLNKIDINETLDIKNIIQYIKTENFGIPDSFLNSYCTTWIDLNNGYIIEFYGTDEYGGIVKGNGKNIFTNGEINYSEMQHCGYKTLPNGFTEYIEEIIANKEK